MYNILDDLIPDIPEFLVVPFLMSEMCTGSLLEVIGIRQIHFLNGGLFKQQSRSILHRTVCNILDNLIPNIPEPMWKTKKWVKVIIIFIMERHNGCCSSKQRWRWYS